MEMELKDIIDEQLEVKQQIVTYKYLTEKLNIHPNKAKQMLNTYVGLLDDDTKYSITVVIGGRLKENDEFCMVMAYGDHLETMRRRYKEIDFEHIYSIQPVKRFDDINNALYLIDNSVNDYSNLPSSIKKNEKQCVSIPKQNVQIENDLLSTKKSSLTSNNEVLNHSNETNQSKLDKTQKKKTGTDFFVKNNKNNVTKTEETEKKETKKEVSPKKTNRDFFTQFKKSNNSDSAKTVSNKEVLKDNIIKSDIKMDVEPPEKTVEEHSVVEQIKKKPNKRKVNGNKVKSSQKAKRKRIQTFNSSDEEVDSEEEDKKRSENVLDVEEDDNDLVQPTPPRPTVRENRKKEKQITTSTFLDDDGFMCTTKEVQMIETVCEPSLEVEDSGQKTLDVENVKSKESNSEQVNKKKKFSEVDTAAQVDKKKAKSKQSKNASNQGMKQSSINSFFLKQNK